MLDIPRPSLPASDIGAEAALAKPRSSASEFILEARPTSLMRKDRQIIDALRGRGGLPVTLRVDHGLPSEEPMLWVPDQVLGATGAAMEGNSEWMDKIGSMTEVVHIDL